MARGWESKSVEQQQADMNDRKTGGTNLSPAQQERNRKREGLLLARKHFAQQLDTATRPTHRQMLENSIAELDKQLASF